MEVSNLLIALFAGCLGLILGSFATVAAHRIPRRESIVGGRSRCPECGATIGAIENVPVLSFLVLRARCRHCHHPISWRYPATEIVTALLFFLTGLKFGASVETVVFSAFFWVLVVLTVIDLEHKLLPNRVVYPAFVVGWIGLVIAAVVSGDLDRLVSAALGAVIFGGFFFAIAFIYPAGMGGGDIKLGFVLGSFLGYLGAPGIVLVGMFLSFLLGSVIGVTVTLARGGGRKSQLPFGPFLALGTAIAIFVGQDLLRSYLGAFS